jgi:multiple sugar transport system permease protein
MLIHGALLLIGALVAFPFFWMLSTSLKTAGETAAFPPILWPQAPQWGNYVEAWKSAPFDAYFRNTAIIAVSVTLSVMVTALLAGYAFGQLEFPGKSALFTLYLSTIFLLISHLGWYDRLVAMIIPWGANVFSVFLLTQFFRSLPKDFFEAAQLDGCGQWQYLMQVGAPLARPALATAGLFAFLGSWNSFLWPLMVTKTEAMRPIEVGLRLFLVEEGPRPHLLMAASTLAMIPILALFFAAQRTFIEGVSAGVKS